MHHDGGVAVIGGGPVGLAAALLLAGQGLQVTLCERHAPSRPTRGAPPAPRVLALSLASISLLEQCGAWLGIPRDQACPFLEMAVWGRHGGRLRFHAGELPADALGAVVDAAWLHDALWQAAMDHPGVQWYAGDVSLEQGTRPAVRTAADVLQPSLVVLADGMFSRSRARAGIPWMWHGYGEQALQAVLQPEMPHDQAARQWFTDEGPMALLPLAHGNVALVWSVPAGYAQQLMAMPEEMLCQLVSRASHWELAACRLVSQRLAQPLACAMAMPVAVPGVVAIGDAAHVVHPLAGQGVNLGFGDADALAGCISEGRNRNLDCGDALVLRAYHNRRLWQQGSMLAGCHGLHALFTSPLAPWASAGLGVVDRLSPLKRFLARTAAGRHGLRQSRESVTKALLWGE